MTVKKSQVRKRIAALARRIAEEDREVLDLLEKHDRERKEE